MRRAWHTPMRSAVMALRRLRRFARLGPNARPDPKPSIQFSVGSKSWRQGH